MSLHSTYQGATYLRELLSKPSERDLQKTIGASDFSNPCTYCVAEALTRTDREPQGRYWLGAKIGTAIHAEIEREAYDSDPELLLEHRVTIGTLPDYGAITSSLDWYDPRRQWLMDHKTTTPEKLKAYKYVAALPEPEGVETDSISRARYTIQKYLGQLMSYGLGLENEGYTPKYASLSFVVRGGKTNDDIWSLDTTYDREYALNVWDRLERLWDYVREGGSLDDLPSHLHCYDCTMNGRN